MNVLVDPDVAAVREAVAVFQQWKELQCAVDDLLSNGFDRSEVSLLAEDRTVEQKLGHVYRRVQDLEDDPSVPRTAFVSQDSLVEGRTGAIGTLGYVGAMAAGAAVVASGGPLLWAALAAAAGGGGSAAVATFLTRWIGRNRAQHIARQMANGGLLLWVRTRDEPHEVRATEILKRCGGSDVHVHTVTVPKTPSVDPLAGFEPDPFLPTARI